MNKYQFTSERAAQSACFRYVFASCESRSGLGIVIKEYSSRDPGSQYENIFVLKVEVSNEELFQQPLE